MKSKIFSKLILSLAIVATIAAPVSAAEVRDNDTNAIIYGGAYSTSELNKKLNNGTGKANQSSSQLKDLFAKNGIYQKDFGQLKDGYVTKDNKVYVGTKLVASNVTTMGRHNIAGSSRDARFSYPIYFRHPSVSFLSDRLPAFVSINSDGSYAYAILKPCGNIVKGPGIKLKPLAPTCTISATPNSVERGSNATLKFSSTNATSANISGIGSVATSGSRTVTPTGNTTYTISATGLGGTVNCSASLVVTEKPIVIPPAPTPAPTPTPTPTPVVITKTVTPAPATFVQETTKGAMPTSGPAEAAAGAVGLTSIGGAALSWAKSKKALLSAIKKVK